MLCDIGCALDLSEPALALCSALSTVSFNAKPQVYFFIADAFIISSDRDHIINIYYQEFVTTQKAHK